MSTIDSTLRDLKQKTHQVLVLKYLLIVVIMAAGGGILFFGGPAPGSPMRAFAETFLYSGVVALVLSVLNDAVLRSEAETLSRIDRTEFATSFAREFFTSHADTVVTDETLLRLMESEPRRATVVRSLASLVTTDPSLRNTVERSYLEPLHRPPRFKAYKALSRLHRYDASTGAYLWSCRHTMKTLTTVRDFRVFVCTDADIAARVEASTRATDFVILLSESSTQSFERWMDEEFDFRVSVADPKTGRMNLLQVEKHLVLGELNEQPGCQGITANDGAYVKLTWPVTDTEVDIDLQFHCTLSMTEDPFFIWTLQDYAFTESIEIDYGGLQPHCGRVSAVPYIRNAGVLINHNRKAGQLQMLVGGLAGPGEGAVLVFRPEQGK